MGFWKMSFGFTNPVLPWYYRGDTRLVKPGQHRIFSLREGGSQFFLGSITEILPWFYQGIIMVLPRYYHGNTMVIPRSLTQHHRSENETQWLWYLVYTPCL